MKAHYEPVTVSPARPGLRERQRQQTHQLIRRTAYDLTIANGTAAVSVQSICEAAGVSVRTFHNHFHSKDEALVPDFPDYDAEAVQAFVRGTEPDLVTALEHLLRGYVTAVHEQASSPAGPAAMRRLLKASPELLPRVLGVFEAQERRTAELIAERTGRDGDDLFCTVAALTATTTLRAAFMTWRNDPTTTGDPLPAPTPAFDTLVAEAFSVLRSLSSGQPVPMSS